MDTNVKRGEFYYADLSPVVGSEQGGVRPVLIVQNDTGNRHSPTVRTTHMGLLRCTLADDFSPDCPRLLSFTSE